MANVTMTADDKFLVMELFSRYAWAFDSGDAHAYANNFTEDARIISPNGDVTAGRANIVPFIKGHMADPEYPNSQHFNSQILFEEGDSKSCTVRSYFLCVRWNNDTDRRYARVMGTYYVKCVKIDGRWFFKERTHRNLRMDTVPNRGPMFEAALAGM